MALQLYCIYLFRTFQAHNRYNNVNIDSECNRKGAICMHIVSSTLNLTDHW